MKQEPYYEMLILIVIRRQTPKKKKRRILKNQIQNKTLTPLINEKKRHWIGYINRINVVHMVYTTRNVKNSRILENQFHKRKKLFLKKIKKKKMIMIMILIV